VISPHITGTKRDFSHFLVKKHIWQILITALAHFLVTLQPTLLREQSSNGFFIGMFKTSLLYTILVTLFLTLHPLMAAGAPQHSDINKPTRERVNKNNGKNASKDAASMKDDDKKNAASVKGAATDNQNKKNTPAKPEDKPAAKKDDVVKEASKGPDNDTAKKAAVPPKPKKVTLNPENVQFDGIDVSKHQGAINWAELKKNSKIKFVYI